MVLQSMHTSTNALNKTQLLKLLHVSALGRYPQLQNKAV